MTSLGNCLRACHRGGLRLAGARHRAVIPVSPARSLSLQHPRSLSPSKLRQNHEKFLNYGALTNSRLLSHSARVLAAQNGPTPPSSSAQKIPKAVIFDLGGVVVPSPQPIFDRFEEQHGLKHGSLIQTIKAAGDDGAFAKLERGDLTVEGVAEPFSADYKRVMGVEISVELVRAFMSLLADFTKLLPNAGVMEVIEKLQSKGIKVAILTNNFLFDSGQRVFPQQQLKNVDVVVESCVEKLRKPDKAIFDITLERLGVAASEAVFLDDLGGNLKMAKQMGMATIKVADIPEALEVLERIVDGNPPLGHIPGTSEVSEKLKIPEDRLVKFLQQKLGLHQEEGAPVIRQFKHGQSNPTYYVAYGGEELVLRKKPPGKLLPSAHAVEREYRVKKATGEAGIPVPHLFTLCEDDSIIGTPFYVMRYVNGRVLKDPALPGVEPAERREIYSALCRVLAAIHSVDIEKAQLQDFGKHGNYVNRQVSRWSKQYEASKTHDIPAMDKLMKWLPTKAPLNDKTTVVHGDFRLDNLIFAGDRPEVLAVLDWELSTLGDPISDLAYCCMPYHLQQNQPSLKGLVGVDVKALGIPTEEEFISLYSELTGMADLTDKWNFYMAFTFFRVAAILQGVYKRSLQDQSSADNAKSVGLMAEWFAEKGWEFAQKQEQVSKPSSYCLSGKNTHRVRKHNRPPIGKKSYSMAAADVENFPKAAIWKRDYSTPAHRLPDSQSVALLTGDVENFPANLKQLYEKLLGFMEEEVYPIEEELFEYQRSDSRWIPHFEVERIKAKAKEQGLWNLFLPLETDPDSCYGAGLTNLEYAHLAEVMGRCVFASEAFNCSPPDTGNMEVLVKYGNEQQKEKWLQPLLAGEIRSCFAMTEPQVASSDATNIEGSIVRDGNDYILNARKWWISGAMDPRCKICIFMGKTDPQAPKHLQQSMVLVPMETEGVRVLRPLTVFGYDDAPGGHAEIDFSNVRVPRDNLLLGEGRGFEIAQGRLGPGRIHHCMRLIGMAERSLELMATRVKERRAFGRTLSDHDTIRAEIAQSRMEIEQARLLTLKAAHMMDTVGNKAAKKEIAMIKVVAPHVTQRVVDRAMQAHGAMGLSSYTPLPHFFSWGRILRFADGPDEVHISSLGKMELKSQRR